MQPKELAVALAAATKAGQLIREEYAKFVPIPDAPSSISTEADRGSQEVILQHLQSVFPDDALCAEEATPTLAATTRHGERLWIVDPIDGTAGFARKNGEFSVMIAFVQGGEATVGVVYEPILDRWTYAWKDGGCWWKRGASEAQRCRVGTAKTLAESAMTQSRSKTAKASPVLALIQPARTVETYSAGVKLALVARGEVDLYPNVYDLFHDWDVCAGHILVSEAGGRVTTLGGTELRYGSEKFEQSGGLLASNGLLHEMAVEKLRSMVKSR